MEFYMTIFLIFVFFESMVLGILWQRNSVLNFVIKCTLIFTALGSLFFAGNLLGFVVMV